MLIGFGCSVPAIMATRTLSSERDRKMTILLTPFMSCSAKLPIYTLMISAFVQRQYRVFAMVGLYLIGIVCAVIYALILKMTKFKGEPVPFVMELPNYRLPSAKSVLHLIWGEGKGIYPESIYDYLPCLDHYLVPADLRSAVQCGCICGSEYACLNRKPDCTNLQAAWIRGLESIHGADHRIYCKRERGINAYGSARW